MASGIEKTDSGNTNSENSKENTVDYKRIQNNINILRQFKSGNTKNIKRYTGFGGLRKAFKDEAIQAALSAFLSPTEIDRLKKSTRTGYFTPNLLIDFIYALIQKLGFSNGKILEPACGYGAFFERMPTSMRKHSEITGVELEPLSAALAQSLYPDVRILNAGFHNFHENEFDLIVGNPPYASFTVFDKDYPDFREAMIHHYFVAKSVHLLKENGLLAMVVPCYVLDNPKRHLRHSIAQVADLVTAYRLPESLFDDAKITVDIVIFKKSTSPKNDWLESKWVKCENGEQFYLSQYFIDHPQHVIGELGTYDAYSYSEGRSRKGLKCVASIDKVKKRLPEMLQAL